jgi:hypothetical protein
MLKTPKRLYAGVLVAAATSALLAPAGADARWRPPVMMRGSGHMGDTMAEYPDVAHASAAQRAAARTLLERVRASARKNFPGIEVAKARGYRKGSQMAAIGMTYGAPFRHFNSESRLADGALRDPKRPESLIYWHAPTGQWLLVGMVFRAPSLHRPSNGGLGPIMRWHTHGHCDSEKTPGNPYQYAAPDACPQSKVAHFNRTVMTHVYLTKSIKTAYAIDVPVRALGITLGKAHPMSKQGKMHMPAAHLAASTMEMGEDAQSGGSTPWLIALAWVLSALGPALALAVMLRQGDRVDHRAARAFAIACLAGVACTHASDLPEHVDDARYMGGLFCLLIIGCCVAGMALAVMPRARPAWLLTGLLCLTTIAGYVVSRSVGLPQMSDHVGQWTEPAGIASLVFEALVVAVSAAAALGLAAPARDRDLARARHLDQPERPHHALESLDLLP